VASVNKQSLREEFAALKGRFEQLVADGKMAAESRELFQALLMLLELLMAVFLERHTPKTSANSGKPSSQTSKDETAVTIRSGSHGKGKQLDQARSANTRTVETVQLSDVSFCEHCGEDLRGVRCRGHERRTQIDIVFEKVVNHIDAETCLPAGRSSAAPDATSKPGRRSRKCLPDPCSTARASGPTP
jgi:hypothetical protein